MLTKKDLDDIRDIVQSTVQTQLAEDLKPLKKDVVKIKKDISVIARTFDGDIVETRRRVDKIESHLNLSSVT